MLEVGKVRQYRQQYGRGTAVQLQVRMNGQVSGGTGFRAGFLGEGEWGDGRVT